MTLRCLESHQTKRFGYTRVKSYVADEDPVYKGVMEAIVVMGGEFPSHVRKIVVLPDTVLNRSKDSYVVGRCFWANQGGSRVEIYAGSIKQAVSPEEVTGQTLFTTLHEIGHSVRGSERQQGFRFGEWLNRSAEEEYARLFVRESYLEHCAKTPIKNPNISWKTVIEQRKVGNLIK